MLSPLLHTRLLCCATIARMLFGWMDARASLKDGFLDDGWTSVWHHFVVVDFQCSRRDSVGCVCVCVRVHSRLQHIFAQKHSSNGDDDGGHNVQRRQLRRLRQLWRFVWILQGR